MTMLFMLNREVRRVPLDFDAPIGETWAPLIETPPEHDFPPCPSCSQVPEAETETEFRRAFGPERQIGDGLTPAARQISQTFHALHLPNGPVRETYRWDDKISQAEVDNLVAKGRLSTWVRDDSERGGHYEQLPREAGEVNALQRRLALDSHDAINRMFLIEHRCQRLGIEMECPTCGGHGDIATDEQRDAAENWKPPPIPEGPGWQLWQTTSEGGPVSPVFETPEGLATWLCFPGPHHPPEHPLGYEEWLRVIRGDAIAQNIDTGELA